MKLKNFLCLFMKTWWTLALFTGPLGQVSSEVTKQRIQSQPVWQMTAKATKKKKEEKTTLPSLPQSQRQSYSYFSNIDPAVVSLVETGSPQSLTQALQRLRKSEIDYAENERVLLFVAQTILKMLYPSQKIEGVIITANTKNAYVGALQSAQNGIYDTSTGNVDFLTTILPSFVITRKANVSQFFTEALMALKEAIRQKPSSVMAHYLLAMLYQKASMLDDALYEYSTAKGLAPDCYEVLYSYCECLMAMGKTKEANTVVSSLIEKNPSSPDLLRLAANTAYTLNNFNAADEYISRVLQQDPNDLTSLIFRAKVLFQKQDYIRTASLLDMYARQNTTDRDYLILRTNLQYEWNHNTSAALESATSALKLYPNDNLAILNAAKIASLTFSKVNGMTASQLAALVLKEEPDNIDALQYSIESLLQSGEYKKAYEASVAVMKVNNNIATAKGLQNALTHAVVCVKSGHAQEAISTIEPLYREHQGDEEVVKCYITVLSGTGGKDSALRLINTLLNSASGKMKSFLYYSRSLLQPSNQDAITDLRNALMNNPRNIDALFHLYQIYFDGGDYRKAQYYLKQVVALSPNNEEYQKLNAKLNQLLSQ